MVAALLCKPYVICNHLLANVYTHTFRYCNSLDLRRARAACLAIGPVWRTSKFTDTLSCRCSLLHAQTGMGRKVNEWSLHGHSTFHWPISMTKPQHWLVRRSVSLKWPLVFLSPYPISHMRQALWPLFSLEASAAPNYWAYTNGTEIRQCQQSVIGNEIRHAILHKSGSWYVYSIPANVRRRQGGEANRGECALDRSLRGYSQADLQGCVDACTNTFLLVAGDIL
jgi:hypothetical protein